MRVGESPGARGYPLRGLDASLWIAGAYALIKVLAYSAWCALGIRWLAPTRKRIEALLFGSVRFLFGLGFGIGIYLAAQVLFAGLNEYGIASVRLASVLVYAAVYVPVRWIEWGLIELMLARPRPGLGGFLAGASARARGWRLGGIAISCLADVPIMLAVGGLPLGRFMC